MRQLLGPDGNPIRSDKVPYDDFALPHALTFSSIIGSASRTYWHGIYDEAIKHGREDALVMRRDATLMGPYDERRLAVLNTPWHLEVPDEKDAVQRAVRDELTETAKGIRGLRRIIWQELDAIWYGRSGVQWKFRWQEEESRRLLDLHKWKAVNGDKIGHTYDGTPYILINAGKGEEDLPNAEIINTTYSRALLLKGSWRERFMIHYHEIEDADYMDAERGEAIHGIGLRHKLFWLDWIRRDWLSWLTEYLERVGLGLTVWFYSEGNANEKAKVEKSMLDNSRRANVSWPRGPLGKGNGSGIERLDTPAAGSEILLRMQQHMLEIEERMIVGQTLSSKSEGGGLGGSGVADLHADTKYQIKANDAMMLAETLTGDDDEPGLISTLQRWSYPETLPGKPGGFRVTWKFDVERAESKDKLEGATKIIGVGVSIKADEVRAAGGFSKPSPEDEVVGQPAAAVPGQPGADPNALQPAPSTSGAGSGQPAQPHQFARPQAPLLYGQWVVSPTGQAWAQQAIASQFDPSRLQQLALAILEQDRKKKIGQQRIGKDANRLSRGLGFGPLGATSHPAAWEKIGSHLAKEHRDHFPDGEHDAANVVRQMIASWPQQPMAEDAAYQQAFAILQQEQRQQMAQQQAAIVPTDGPERLERIERLLLYAFDEAKIKRDDDGKFSANGGGSGSVDLRPAKKRSTSGAGSDTKPNTPPDKPTKPDPVKAAAAKRVVKRKSSSGGKVGKREHLQASRVEKEVAKELGQEWEPDNKPYDCLEAGKVATEVKSILKGKKNGIQVHEDALLRKANYAAENPGQTFQTVAIDERNTYAGGKFADRFSGHKLYYKRGCGKYSFAKMHQAESWDEIRKLQAMPESELPEKARGSLPSGDELKALAVVAAKAAASRKVRDKRNHAIYRENQKAKSTKRKAAVK